MKRTLAIRKRNAVVMTCLWLLSLSFAIARPALAAVTYATLRYGDSGSAVTVLQKALESLGFDPGKIDGKYGKGTVKAIKYFQESVKLTADGIAGNKTQTALYKKAGITVSSAVSGQTTAKATAKPTATPKPTATTYATLRYGDQGSQVKKMQKALALLGYYTSTIDSKYGAGTQRAVTQFQKKYGLKKDGVAGNETLTLLYKKAEKKAAATATPTPTPTPKPTPDAGYNTSVYTRTLKSGMTGTDVQKLQKRLIALDYEVGSADGSYGEATKAAVLAFQQRNSLYADGIAGTQTFVALYSSDVKKAATAASADDTASKDADDEVTPPVTYSTLRLNSTGSDVTTLQKKLKALGYSVTATGTYDSKTQSAVLAFQLLNGLASDGIAGAMTQTKLYSGSAKKYDASALTNNSTSAPSKSQVQLLHWYNVVKPSLRNGKTILIYEPKSKLSWTLKLYSLGHHADSEPLTLADTNTMNKAFGTVTWTPLPVYVKLPDGRWTMATMHNVPHLSGSIATNGFDGHLCVHFLRDMSEVSVADPKYGVQHQNALRAAWKALTGEVVN